MSTINILLGEKYYNKDPQSSDLGRNIVSASIIMISELGFEQFTFKKLADEINSTEASVYRYFDNKLKLLVYLTTWYWAWVEYLVDFKTHHIRDNEEKLKEIINILCHTEPGTPAVDLPGIDTSKLSEVVISEADKTYLTKEVDAINQEGLFKGFKALCHKIAMVILDIKPDYPYPHSLVSTIMEASHRQSFFAEHLPSLTEISIKKKEPIGEQVSEFIQLTVFKSLK